MERISDGWFTETEVLWPGQRFALKVEEVLFHDKSEYQDILVFQSSTYGRVLVLDGVIQLTERDEFAYQEMITHIPLFAHPNPKKVLIIGGGDGGVLREICRHESVELIHMCEIDGKVIETAKTFFGSSTATAYSDPRLSLFLMDGAIFLQTQTERYDVIVVDASDPVGPAESLFQSTFFQSLKSVLSPGGIICTQGECQWLHLPIITSLMAHCSQLFPIVEYAYTTIPTYPSGQIGFIICGLIEEKDAIRNPSRTPSEQMQSQLRYYNSEIHRSAFVLPEFTKREIRNAIQQHQINNP
jgi:spermidine synthase